ncbi:MAG: crotonase/enoyl-CoA hydratase family protein [Acidimicrobiales bacterium]
MTDIVAYQSSGGVATLRMDDGKVNALSPEMLAALSSSLDRAAAEQAVVVLTGRSGTFSAGFDLKTLRAGGTGAAHMLDAGFSLAEQMLSFPRPLIIACSGHAVAMASFLLLCGDYRLGVAGPFRITANEVAIGLPMPRAAVAICRQRLAPAHFHRAVALAEVFSPQGAMTAGFLDEVADDATFGARTMELAAMLASLDPGAHRQTKALTREPALDALRRAIAADAAEWGPA